MLYRAKKSLVTGVQLYRTDVSFVWKQTIRTFDALELPHSQKKTALLVIHWVVQSQALLHEWSKTNFRLDDEGAVIRSGSNMLATLLNKPTRVQATSWRPSILNPRTSRCGFHVPKRVNLHFGTIRGSTGGFLSFHGSQHVGWPPNQVEVGSRQGYLHPRSNVDNFAQGLRRTEVIVYVHVRLDGF